MPMDRRVTLRIEGRVQGVWFRKWTCEQALRLGLDGWVRNRRDGSVEAVLSGDSARVDQMIVLCYQGPAAAEVDQVIVSETPETPVFSGFHQWPTK